MGDRRSETSQSNDSTSATDRKTPPRNGCGEGGKSRVFRIPSHSDTILQTLNKQRIAGEFCDITVLVEHQRFSAHKCVLAANSIYFKSLLSTDNDGVFLRHVTAESFKAILDFMYTSRLQLEATSVQDVLSAAKFLQVKGVISICCRYLESQIRNLARDLDEHKKKTAKPAMISVDADLFKSRDFQQLSPLQQQPQITYNPDTGAFEPDSSMMVIDPVHQHAIPFQKTPMTSFNQPPNPATALSMSPGINQNGFNPNPLPHSLTLRTRNFNNYPAGNNLPNGIPNTTFRSNVIPLVHQPVQTSPAIQPASSQPWNGQNYTPSFFPFGNSINSRPPNERNPFSFGVTRDQLVMPPHLGAKPAQPNHHYTAQSTGGKGRRMHPQARRKGGHGTVSDTGSLKFTLGSNKFTFNKPLSTSTPVPSLPALSKAEEPNMPVLTLSSARDNKVKYPDKKPGSPDTIFDVEAEDRYWDALSTRRQLDID